MTIKFNYTDNNNNNQVITLSEGNTKLQPTEKVKVLIWSLPAIITCPYATEQCKKNCYALKAEKMYPSVKKCREEQFNASVTPGFASAMIKAIEKALDKKSYKAAQKVVIRIHEDGDFYSAEYLEKWLEVINHFEDNSKVQFLCYTKSLPFFAMVKGATEHKNFTINSSIWADTDPEMVTLTRLLNLPVYTAGTSEQVKELVNNGYKECRCADCMTCLLCLTNKNKVVEIH